MVAARPPKRTGSYIGEEVFIGGQPGRSFMWDGSQWVITDEWTIVEYEPEERRHK